jgi:uncharacterized protein (TIGR00369 family)
MKTLSDQLAELREAGDAAGMAELVPYARWLGLTWESDQARLRGKLAYTEMLVGNPILPALHGGALGALLESTAIMEVIWQRSSSVLPKTINITVDYLRSARPIDTWAEATITKSGRRVVSVRADAWQDDRDRLIATATAHFLVMAD